MKSPGVSIVMPVFNNRRYLKYSITSILNQTYKDFEFVIINDGSEEQIEDIINFFKDSRIVYRKTKHQGIAKALNYGIDIASSSLIARMDSDDLAVSDRIECQLNFLTKNPEYDVVSCRYAVFKNKHILYIIETPEFNEEIKNGLILHNVICHPGVIFRKELIKISGGYRDVEPDDYDLWLRIKDKAVFYNIKSPLMLIRYNKSSLTRKNLIRTNSQVYKLQKIYFADIFNSDMEQINPEYSGWREYFYGNKRLSRKYWRQNKKLLLLNLKILIAYISTYLPWPLFMRFKENRLRLRLNYLFKTKSLIKNKLKNSIQVLTN